MATVERTKLYQQLWSIPGSQLAIMYGISDVGLAKVCKRYSIPRPPRGYWARLAAGQRVPQSPLPIVGEGLQVIQMKGWSVTDETIQQLADDQRLPPTPSTGDHNDSPPHPLAAATRANVSELKPSHDGRITTDSASALDLTTSPALVDRGLAIMDMLIKRWVGRGGTVRVGAGRDRNQTAFAIGSDELYIEGVEAVDESKPLTDPTRLSGRLTIFIRGDERREFKRRWSDTKAQRLEKMVNPLLDTLSTALAAIKAERLDAECVKRQEQSLDLRRKADANHASREFYWRQELTESVSRWHAAQQIHAYLDALARSVEEGHSRVNNENTFKTWMDWARRYADSIDPIRRAPLPGDPAVAPKNTPIGELDLTSYTASALTALGVKDTDQLAGITGQQVQSVARPHASNVWSEITRILACLGYPTSKRRDAPY